MDAPRITGAIEADPALRGAPLPLANARASTPNQPSAQMKHVAEQFEAVFLSEMLAPMFENLDTDGLGGGGEGERMFRPMLVEKYAESLSQAGGIGISDAILREMIRMQGGAPQPNVPPSNTSQESDFGPAG